MKKYSRLKKMNIALKDSKKSEWCIVDTENIFEFDGKKFKIGNVKEYKVYNKSGEVDDYTNETLMDKVLSVLNNDDKIVFYDMTCTEIDDVLLVVGVD